VPIAAACRLPATEGGEEAGAAAVRTSPSWLRADDAPGVPAGQLLDPALPVAAAAAALAEWLGDRTVVVDVADHAGAWQAPGRPRLVGQLAAVGTVALTPRADGDPAATVRAVREQLAASGRPAPDGPAAAQIRCNHLGDLTALVPAAAPFTLAPLEGVELTALPSIQPYLLEIDGYVRDGRLRLDWRCSHALQRRLLDAEVPRRAATWLQRLVHASGGAG
jgi:hypothetical protein